MDDRIIVVDDEREIADLIGLYLENDGYEVHKFLNGTDALSFVEKCEPALAVLDVMLPDTDGFALLRKMREKHDFPIIMLTARVTDSDKILGLTIGAGLYTVSVIGYAALMCCLALFPTFEIDLKNRSNHFEVHLELKNREDLQRFITTMRTLGLKIDDIEANPAYINSGLSVYSVSLTVRQKDRAKYSSHQEMIKAINTLDFVYYAEEID